MLCTRSLLETSTEIFSFLLGIVIFDAQQHAAAKDHPYPIRINAPTNFSKAFIYE